MNLSVVCVLKSGGLFTPEYVHRLKDMVERNIQYEFRFDCLTDYAESYLRNDINVIPFQVDFPWKWSKINLWNPYNSFLERILYLDLDSIILKDLTLIVDYPADFVLVHQWKKNMKSRFGRLRNLNYKSCVMAWNHNARPELWNDFSLGVLDKLVGDQDWIGERLPNENTLPDGWFNEQRYFNSEQEIPGECKVLGVTSKGKNEQAVRENKWMQKYWGGPCTHKRSKVTYKLQDKITVATYLWGNWADGVGKMYVRKLRDAVARHLSIPHKFVCISDQSLSDIDVETWPLKAPSRTGNLPKLSIFSPNYPFHDRTMIMDLDMIITGNIDEIASYDGEFAARAAFRTRDGFWKPDGDMFIFSMLQSRRDQIWKEITKDIRKIESKTNGAERRFYEQFYKRYFPDIDFIQELFPGQLVSYKQDNVRGEGLPRNARIVSFHGRPKPHQLTNNWIRKHWK